MDFHNDCGFISKSQFTLNQLFFAESQSCNTCLHKKVSIDMNGKIKNCPSSNKLFGDIKRDKLMHAINSNSFKDLWYVKKDEIQVCRDCEYRYMCLDCRVFVDDPDNNYSRPSKCGYNPYIGKWSDEDGYVPLKIEK